MNIKNCKRETAEEKFYHEDFSSAFELLSVNVVYLAVSHRLAFYFDVFCFARPSSVFHANFVHID